jgi:hypothetical protein
MLARSIDDIALPDAGDAGSAALPPAERARANAAQSAVLIIGLFSMKGTSDEVRRSRRCRGDAGSAAAARKEATRRALSLSRYDFLLSAL